MVARFTALSAAKERSMIRLYLHPDLCKAEGQEATVTKVAPGVAQGVPKPEMRIRRTTHKKTAGKQRAVAREERKYAGTVTDKPPYQCPGCKGWVRPPRSKRSPEGKVVGEHHAEMVTKEGKHTKLPHGTVTAEMLPSKTHSGRKMSGFCPGCHEARKPKTVASARGRTPEEAKAKLESQTNKAISMLNDLAEMAKSGEGFGKPMEKRKGESSNEFMSRVISHLVKDKGYDQKRAVAAAYRMTGHPKAGKPVEKSIQLVLAL
jgi:hypothetical protein